MTLVYFPAIKKLYTHCSKLLLDVAQEAFNQRNPPTPHRWPPYPRPFPETLALS